jgi:2-polyprenyl-3-methyl-5-hydroxy-6-metoxy-1,4-benzoquinol methylase
LFSTRSYQKELLDRDDIPFADIEQNMRELDFINTWLGGHDITINGFKQLIQKKKDITVCEIGCGGGDNLYAIAKWCEKNGIGIKLVGIDINSDCIAVAQKRLQHYQPRLIASDYKKAGISGERPDIIFSSLFCHHFTNEELVYMLQWMGNHSATGFFINDLQRHPLAYYSIKMLTRFFSKSYLVKNDAPLSVKRGFIKQEWNQLLQQAGITNYSLQWKWAFRWLLIVPINSITQ